jgi:TIR domain
MRLKSELPHLVRIGDGVFGTVYEVLGYTMRANPTTPLAYKEYKLDQADVRAESYALLGAAAENAVEFRRRIASRYPSVCAEIDKYFAWPREIVKDEKTDERTGQPVLETCGFLMPLAPKDFFWETGRPAGRLRTLDWLAIGETYWRKMELETVMSTVTLTDRLELMTQMASAFAVLHKQDWVVGNFSFANAAFTLFPPRLMLFDCDDAASLSDQNRHQPHTPNWYPPECEGPQGQRQQNHQTDVYKLGLAIVRCLKPEPGATTTRDAERLVGILDTEGLDLVTRALSDIPSVRPTADELYRYLKLFTDPRISPPIIEQTELTTPVVWRGADGQADGRVVWRIANAGMIEILLGEDQPETVRTVTLDDYPAGCAFPVTRPGKVTVVASNRYGRQAQVIGDVTIFAISPSSLDFYKVTSTATTDNTVKPSKHAGHAFISYVREDTRQVDQLQRALQSVGVSVWRDTASLWPGEDWRVKIRRAITDDALVFIACFSQKSLRRQKSYQNEELILAIEQLRLHRPEEPWLIPVRFDNCQIPDLDIGLGRTLRSLHFVDLFGERSDESTARLVATILRMLVSLSDKGDLT